MADVTITPGIPISGAVAVGARVSQSDVVVPDLVARLVHRSAPTTSVATLDDAYDKRWLDQLNDAGSGGLTLDNDDTDLALIGDTDMIRFELFGVAAMTILAREFNRHSVDGGEEYGEVTEITGPGHLAILDEAVVYPSRGVEAAPVEDDRAFNWAATVFDDATWVAATEVVQQSSSADWWYDSVSGTHMPNTADDTTKWPDGSAFWLWASTGTEEWAAEGTCYFRRDFTVPAGTYKAWIYLTCDDSGQLYIDGQRILDTDNQGNTPTDVRPVLIDITPGAHTLAAAVTNAPDPEGDTTHNPAGLLYAVYPADIGGTITDSVPIIRSDASTVMVEYPPSPPGMTPGEVMIVALEEAQARGGLTGVTWTFTREVDSDGNAWPEVTDIATKVGTDYLTFFKEIADSYCDISMSPSSLTLNAWLRDGRGETKSVTLQEPTDATDPATGNLTTLTHRKVI